MATLFIASGELDGRWFPLGKKALVVGRDEGLIAQVPDPSVSRKHISIRFDADNGRYLVSDLNSRNGAFLNDQKINGEAMLKDSDLIRIGDTLLLFVSQDFQGEENALNFYRQRGERSKVTTELRASTVREGFKKMQGK
jgi:pSer/pThr/pTyr-binding forkhead associated (FHA) protein